MSLYSVPLTYLRGSAFSQPKGFVNDFTHLPRPLYSLAYIVSGSALFVCGNERIRVGEGDVIFVPKECCYYSVWEGEPQTNFLSCHFDLIPFGEPVGNRKYALQKIEGCHALYEDFASIVLQEHTGVESLHAVGRFFEILATLFPKMQSTHNPPVNERILRAVRYIEGHYDTPLRVSELATVCHLSESYFYEYFKREMGMSPIEYKNRITIQHAQQILLSNEDLSIEELSEKLGFESSIYFRRLFKRLTGKTPREYRRTAQEEF